MYLKYIRPPLPMFPTVNDLPVFDLPYTDPALS